MSRTTDRGFLNDRTYRNHWRGCLPQGLAHVRNGQDRANTRYRVTRTDDNRCGVLNCFEDSRRGPGILDSGKSHCEDVFLPAVLDEIFLKREPPARAGNLGLHVLIRHWYDAGLDTERLANGAGRLRQRETCAHEPGSGNVGPQVA